MTPRAVPVGSARQVMERVLEQVKLALLSSGMVWHHSATANQHCHSGRLDLYRDQQILILLPHHTSGHTVALVVESKHDILKRS